ncbi:MAG: hypothetical protein JWO03_1379 [Bacteroidetes bacterium]|nr:hypothetical protein [Bacteroidota bacterium]
MRLYPFAWKALLFLLSFSYTQTSFSQINPEDYAKDFSNLNNIETTYLVAFDLKSPNIQKYFQVLKENWKLSPKVALIDNNAIPTVMSRKALFIYPGISEYCLWSMTEEADKHHEKWIKPTHGDISYVNVNYIEGYHCVGVTRRPAGYFAKGGDAKSIFELPEEATVGWGEGFFKNRLQSWQLFIRKYEKNGVTLAEQKKMAQDMKVYIDEDQIKKVKEQVLYVTDPREGKQDDVLDAVPDMAYAQELMKNYTHKWKMLTTKELNAKIMNATEPFYYAIFGDASAFHVVNAKTGESVYLHHFGGVRLDAGMFKRMVADID